MNIFYSSLITLALLLLVPASAVAYGLSGLLLTITAYVHNIYALNQAQHEKAIKIRKALRGQHR